MRKVIINTILTVEDIVPKYNAEKSCIRDFLLTYKYLKTYSRLITKVYFIPIH